MSVFRGALEFLGQIGVYDVVLPLLLIFSIVFAILEKTRVFGTEKYQGQEVTRKNVNAMVAFVMAFFVVASAQLVATIHQLVANVALVIVAFVMFMILIGVFLEDKKLFLEGTWQKVFMGIAFTALALIFFNALGWLQPAWFYVMGNWDSTLVATILLLGVMVALIMYVTGGSSEKREKKDS